MCLTVESRRVGVVAVGGGGGGGYDTEVRR